MVHVAIFAVIIYFLRIFRAKIEPDLYIKQYIISNIKYLLPNCTKLYFNAQVIRHCNKIVKIIAIIC